MMFKKILVPVNPLKDDEDVVKTAIELAKQLGARIHMVTIVTADDTNEALEKRRGAIDKYAEMGRKQGVETSHELLDIRCKAEEIPKKTVDMSKDYDMIVMGHYKFEKIYRFIRQSTAQDLINMASCPVVVIPEEREKSG